MGCWLSRKLLRGNVPEITNITQSRGIFITSEWRYEINKNKQPETYKERVKLLFELLSETEDETPEEIDQYLREAGYDPDALAGRLRKKIRKTIDESPGMKSFADLRQMVKDMNIKKFGEQYYE